MTIRRGSLPAVIGIGAVAVGIAVATWIEAASGGQPGSVTQPGAPIATGAAAARAPVGQAGGTGAGNASTDAAGMTVSLPLAGAHVIPGTGATGAPWAAPTSGSTPSTASASTARPGTPPRQLIVPDVIAAAPGGITPAEIASIRRLGQVRGVLAIDGARITVNGKQVNILSAPAAQLRSWTPPATAASQAVWSDFARGDLITTASAASGLGLQGGHSYPATAAVQGSLTFGTQALLAVPGVDGIVSPAQGQKLGLVKNVAVLINAPAARMDALTAQVKRIVGAGGQAITLVPEQSTTDLPVNANVPTGRPTNYMMLYQESAARYCPGLSWTVLAAIGEIESNNGQNVGPSSAGALGPMQFLPSTWAAWGIDGFGDTGTPNIMNPFDAVPSAAHMLCADGAGQGGQSLRQAIFDYNHATWYVDEVLTLAGEYAREYG